MQTNRSLPRATVIPELAYADVNKAAEWLCRAFGFRVRIKMGSHRVQMHAGGGAVIATEVREEDRGRPLTAGHAVMVRMQDVDAHWRRAGEAGAKITREPRTYPYGERQYNAEDLAGYAWAFSESVANVDPAEWGGTAVELEE
ncbi:MAG TPA: VOC family protein [Terracidiphilus sp.]|nr:VOC family protein [Terracidiphilus sp.]